MKIQFLLNRGDFGFNSLYPCSLVLVSFPALVSRYERWEAGGEGEKKVNTQFADDILCEKLGRRVSSGKVHSRVICHEFLINVKKFNINILILCCKYVSC